MTALISPLPYQARILSAPDWRLRWLASVPALIWHGARVTKNDVPDVFLREVLLPFAQRRYGHPIEMNDHDWKGMLKVFESYDNKANDGMSALISEGCALAGAPFDCGYLTTSHQDFYEAVFFDIRPSLDDVGAIVDLVFEPLSRAMPHSSSELEGKVVAYGLGIEQFHCWERSNETPEILALRRELEKLEKFRVDLEGMGLSFTDVWSRELCRLLRSIRAGDIPEGRPKFTSQKDWKDRLERLNDVVPKCQEM